jgi:hypothetical protein
MIYILSILLYNLLVIAVNSSENDKRDVKYSGKGVVVVDTSLGAIAGLNIGLISTFLGIVSK